MNLLRKEYFEKTDNISFENDKVKIVNNSDKPITITFSKRLIFNESMFGKYKFTFKGSVTNSGGYLMLNYWEKYTINSDFVINIKQYSEKGIHFVVAANSTMTVTKLEYEFQKDINLFEKLDNKADVLVIVPEYPSYVNLYSCAFAHTRNREYVKNGLNIQVFVVNPTIDYQLMYTRDNVPVAKGSYSDLKVLLSRHQYTTIVTHFVDEYLYPIFDGNVYSNQKLIFICHGPETVYKYLVNKTRPYFTKPYKEPVQMACFDEKDFYVKKYSQKENVEWVFVSDWLKNFSEEQQGLKFKNSRVINNFIDGDLFPYVSRDASLRKKILTVRKFDNISQHSIDQIVRMILELSRRDFFDDLSFDIYGDGNFYDELVEPIKKFKNVNLIRKFIPNEKLYDVYKNHGVILLPSRHDAHAVSMGEAASTGLVVVGSNVTSNPYFMNEKENHTLTDPEDYVGLADIIERIYKDENEFLRVSNNMHEFTSQFNKKNTVEKEIQLIKKCNQACKKLLSFEQSKPLKPVLTIGIPAYNVEKYIAKTLVSILNCPNANKIEVLVINDGSKDKTAEIVKKFEKESNGIVRLINKENGGHGSTINRSIKEAKGKYFRLVDGDDWVDSENLAKLVDIMSTSDSDIILTKGSYDYIEEAKLVNIINYDNLVEGNIYKFEDLVYQNYGFEKYGPLLTTGNYKTQLLRKADFQISEKKPYVDMEFNAFSIKCMDTITYYDLNIYRYLIGREGQTISPEYWKKKYKDHESVILNILEKTYDNQDYSENKRKYILNNIISPMVDSQIFMFDAICKWDEIDSFLNKIKQYPEAYKTSMQYINKLGGNCDLILAEYKNKKYISKKKPIIIPGIRESKNDLNKNKITVKKIIKATIPYGLLYYYRKYKQK